MERREQSLSMRAGLAEIFRHLSRARRRQFYFLLALMLVGAIAELGTIGSIIPFLALLAGQTLPGHLAWTAGIFAPFTVGGHAVRVAGVVFVVFVLLAGGLKLELTWVQRSFTHWLAHDLTVETQRRILAQPYAFHIERNSSTLIASVDMVEILALEVVLPLMQTLTAAFTAAVILAGLVYIDPFTASLGAVAFGAMYIAFSTFAAKRLARNSAVLGESYQQRVKIIQESIGGIRDTIIDGSQAMHLRFLAAVNGRLASARATTSFIAAAPRYLVESIGIVTIAAIAGFVSLREGGLAPALPFLGALGLGAQRLLPLLQNIYTGWTTAAGSRSSIGQVLELLRLPVDERHGTDAGEIPLKRQIAAEGLSFSYPSRESAALDKLDFQIPAGSMVALVGKTGSGKTTLADVLMGLLEPASGLICIDGVRLTPANVGGWWRGIAHVPQAIFLADASIERNIALSLPDAQPNRDRVIEAAKKAQLHEFIASLPEGYDTHVGERGIRLSGGQRQRLGIARAIYKNAPILVLDEATSALDYDTEAAVVEALNQLQREGRTIIIIAHRLSTVEHCDFVARLEHGRLVEFGPANEVLAAKAKRS